MTYQTEQRSQLIAFLKKHKDRAYTIDAIVSGMQADPRNQTSARQEYALPSDAKADGGKPRHLFRAKRRR